MKWSVCHPFVCHEVDVVREVEVDAVKFTIRNLNGFQTNKRVSFLVL